MKLDEKGMRVLNALIRDSRQSYRALAKEARVSIVTIANKMKDFKKRKIILGHTTVVDYDKIGYDVHVLIEIRVSLGKELVIERKLLNSPNVHAIYDVTGEHDILVMARFKNRRELDKYLKHIQTFEFVQRVHTSLILDTIKEKSILID